MFFCGKDLEDFSVIIYKVPMMTEKILKNPKVFKCELCNLITCSSKDYKTHLSTLKHKMMSNDDALILKNPTKYLCNCGKMYKYRQGLALHKKTCHPITDASHNFVIDKELVMSILKQNADIIKENSELKNMMMEVIKTGTHHTTHTNSHNKTFNLQFFLNETCKNAMNIMDFVDSLKLQLCDLERMGEIGFVNGMSNIIIKNLQSMDITERPVHCTDQKREVMYVKDDGKWDKEEETKPKLRKAIKHIAHKNAKLIGEFKTKYPDYKTCATKIATQYNTMVIEAMGGVNCVDAVNENKIIKRISKEIMVEKDI